MKLLFLIICLVFVYHSKVLCITEEKWLQMSKSWADRLGADLWVFGLSVSRKELFVEKYNKSISIVVRDGDNLTKEIVSKIKDMMDLKVSAVERIMDTASILAASSSKDKIDESFQYYDAKELINNLTDPLKPDEGVTTEKPHAEEFKVSDDKPEEGLTSDEFLKDLPQNDDIYQDDEAPTPDDSTKEVVKVTDGETESVQASQQESQTPTQPDRTRLNLTENPNFFNIPVNLEHSAVHVPSNVYNRSHEVIRGIQWSEKLDSIFVENYKGDPTLSWQYFGSYTGFMRQFPAMIWHQEPVDAFDCRTRSWFIEAATSPKDIVILVDRSGSMTGMQKEIAKHVVNNILDTLGNNDYVNIFTFSNVTDPLIPCFNDTLVQANLANVRELKENMDTFKTENIANFSVAFTIAFQLLQNYRIGSRNKSGAGCNQAIMLITDGVQYNYKEIFKEYNWRDLPYKPVRVFTYLIGREVSDVREVKWMACANQGYYVHLSTFAEVREQVLHYIPVMARPMVLWGHKPKPTWSPVYADVTDPKLTNWLWTQRQRRDQKERFLAQRKDPHRHSSDADKKFVHQQKKPQDNYGDLQPYTLMTSVSMPVYDTRQNANITEEIYVKEGEWETVIRETRVANLLGVAGTDVPIAYIQQLMMPHLIGVNGYAYIITNNGYILIHPDLRPVFEGILKPAYNRVDMAEVELTDDDLEPREYNRTLIEMRREMVFQKKEKKTLDMRYHIDSMKRVMRGRRHFHYMGIENTPFTLVVALPDKYGSIKTKHISSEDVYLQLKNKMDITKNFQGSNWKIHPNWIYCKYISETVKFNSSEEELVDFLKKMMAHERMKWSHKNTSCDRDLVNTLVFEAKITNFFDQNITTSEEKKGHEFIKRFGITIAFISTHSGLTRWQDFPQNIPPPDEGKPKIHFSNIHNKAIDEIWYRRAVEHHYIEEDSFVYSVPHESGADKDTQITASHAVFITNKKHKTPVAVVGYQFYHANLVSFFKNLTANKCDENSEMSCYILDNNGYIMMGTEDEETGIWLGDVEYGLMKMLVDEGIYNKILIYDYQAVCFPVKPEENSGANFLKPFKQVTHIVQWALTTIIYFIHVATGTTNPQQEYEPTSESPIISNQPPTKQTEKEFDKSILINKTKPTPCDERRWLYELIYYRDGPTSPYNKPMKKIKPFVVQKIQYSNLILFIVKKGLKFEEEYFKETPTPEEIDYNQTLACKLREDDLSRRRYAKCINKHMNESGIEMCGRASILHNSSNFIRLAFALQILLHIRFYF